MAFHGARSSSQQSCKVEPVDLPIGPCKFKDHNSAQTWHDPADVEEALDRSLRDLGVDYGRIAVLEGGRTKGTSDPYFSGPLPDALYILNSKSSLLMAQNAKACQFHMHTPPVPITARFVN